MEAPRVQENIAAETILDSGFLFKERGFYRVAVERANEPRKGPVARCCEQGPQGCSRVVVGQKADVNAKSKSGWPPLHCAADYGFKDIVELLLANHADVNALSERTVVNTDPSLALYEVRGGWTPYHMAEAKGHKDVAELLRQHGGHE